MAFKLLVLAVVSLAMVSSALCDAECGHDAGDAVCLFGSCCSKDGMCGSGDDYCGDGCQEGAGRCYKKGGAAVGKGMPCGSDAGDFVCFPELCCSKDGFCGSGDDFCGDGCQPAYGECDLDSGVGVA